jgi:hypothetical protein
MESAAWALRTLSGTALVPYVAVLFMVLVLCWDYPLFVPYFLACRALGRSPYGRSDGARALPLLVVIPSLLRQRDELTSMMSTVESVATNGYPGELVIIVTIDGTHDAPHLYDELLTWAGAQRWNDRTSLHVTGTPVRRSKPMAIDHAMGFMKSLVAQGRHGAFPPVYVSTDADADLAHSALELIVSRLQRRNRITGWPARVVSGALHVRGNTFWQGWRHFFTIAGQLNLQVAREYYVSNIARYNVRCVPMSGVPGAFYCTWSEIFLSIPLFMGYMRTLKTRHWLGWWFGVAPPKFSKTRALPVPELMAGDTDDTVTSYVASIARFAQGHFVFDPPRTPLHALWYVLRASFVDRPIQYEPRAKVFTSSPATVRALFKQRKRWNTSRIELTGRFWKSLGYHWQLGVPVIIVKTLIARSVIIGAIVYVWMPAFLLKSSLFTGVVLGYLCSVVSYGMLTALSMMMNGELRYWRLAFALPASPLYVFLFNWLPGAVGATCDVLLFGNVTGFAPESTLIKGGSVRIALLSRLWRAFSLTVRSVVYGDVPLGRFWLGWGETSWTPSGFEGFTTKRRRRIVPPLTEWFRKPRAIPGFMPGLSDVEPTNDGSRHA